MRRGRIKRKNKWILFKIIPYFFVILMVLLSVYFTISFIFGSKIISPLAQKYLSLESENVSEDLSKAGISFSSVKRSNDSLYVVTLSDGGQVIITSAKNIKSQISSLQLMLSRLTIEGKRVKVIDFRYDRPVVRF